MRRGRRKVRRHLQKWIGIETVEARVALTRDAQETIKSRADTDPEFRRALVEEATECLRTGDAETAKAVMGRLRPSRSSQ
jgi:hypothetical protein